MTSPSVRRASEACQVSERQLYRYLEDSAFRQELNRLEGEVLDTTVRRLVRLSTEAVDALEDVLKSPAQSGASIRLRASVAVLEHVLKLRELMSLEGRVKELEQVVIAWDD